MKVGVGVGVEFLRPPSLLGGSGGGAPVAGATWNSARKAAEITLSNGDRTATSSDTWRSVLGGPGKATGKFAMRFQGSTNGNGFFVGIVANATDGTPAQFLYQGAANYTDCVTWYGFGATGANNIDGVQTTPGVAYTGGILTVPVEVAVDLESATKTCQFIRTDTSAVFYSVNLPAAADVWYPAGSVLGPVSLTLVTTGFTPILAGYSPWTE